VKKTIILGAMAIFAIGAFGCANKKTAGIPTNESVADVSTPAPAMAYQPAPMPVAQPVIYDSAVSQAPAASSGAMGGGTYTVKKGDTLYSIARQRYGDGKQWSRIASANPGLHPQSLKVGQTITIP
jgi:5'-nucleotidase/UDP-sugar diphosphatase